MKQTSEIIAFYLNFDLFQENMRNDSKDSNIRNIENQRKILIYCFSSGGSRKINLTTWWVVNPESLWTYAVV